MSNNVDRTVTRVSTLDGAPDIYDHEISLIDATTPQTLEEQRAPSPGHSWRDLARNPTRASVKGRLVKRKYAKWQETRLPSTTASIITDPGSVDENQSSRPPPSNDSRDAVQSETVDFARSETEERGRNNPNKSRRPNTPKDQIYEIDVLYENQRGSFFCGIPLYSHSSLMPIDPSPWVNKEFHESPVNITNAQVPDPSWSWAWKAWYVDMSYDVDEEGWQYSFAFGRNFAWHGTHPWFHSFVRRRRWLRKRVKRSSGLAGTKQTSMGAAHHLTAEYFTIHSKRDQSPASGLDEVNKLARPSSYVSYQDARNDDELPEDIKDIGSLLKALRLAAIDREKIELVKRFVQAGGPDLECLKDHIPEIMSFLVFQNSRRQLLAFLKETAEDARKHRQQHQDEGREEGPNENHRISSLLAAVDVANKQICGLEYWSDRKHVLKTVDDDSEETTTTTAKAYVPSPGRELDLELGSEIKGISGDAGIKADTSPVKFKNAASTQEEIKEKGDNEDKGKGRAHESEDDQIEDDSPTRLKTDQLLVPDDD